MQVRLPGIQGMDASSVTTLIPLLFLVVTQLAQVGRKVNLQAALAEGRNPLGIPIIDSIPGVPPLGQLNFIHGVNLVQLTVGLILVTALSDGWLRGGLTVLTWLMFVILPVLEVETYVSILSEQATPIGLPVTGWPFYSFHAHLLLSTMLTFYILLVGIINSRELLHIGQQPDFILLFFIGLLTLGVATYGIYLWLLSQELKNLKAPSATNNLY